MGAGRDSRKLGMVPDGRDGARASREILNPSQCLVPAVTHVQPQPEEFMATPDHARAVLLVALVATAACSDGQQTAGYRTAAGATIGAIAGGSAGAAIDRNDARGPLIGAALGGGIGYALDRQEAELEQALERQRTAQQATVERLADDRLKVTIDDAVAFDYQSTAIRPDFLPTIEQVAEVLAANPVWPVQVIGHTDSVGSATYNRELSLARADAVRDALAVYGVDPARIRVEGRGEFEPRASNETEAGRAANRRVEILITA
jgi:outer membrane protein OmpA-like peptidoglycan-associated protein